MRAFKFSIIAVSLLGLFGLPAFAHDDPNGMHISTKSPQAHLYFEKGMHKMEMLHIQDGLDNFRKSVQADPQFALGHIILMFFTQDPTEQVTERELALKTRQFANREEQYIIDWLGNASQAQWIPAIQAMNEALDTYPHDKHLAWLAGWWLVVHQNQSARALPLFERVIKIDPRFADAWNEAAYCYARLGNFDKAFSHIQHYTELVPNEANPQDSFAEISRMAGHFDQALKHYHMSLKIDPTFHESQLGLGDTYALMGDEPKAREEYAVAISEGSTVQKVTWGLQSAATYVREGDFAAADNAFRSVAQQAHDHDFANLEAEAFRSMAMYQKDSTGAMDLLKKAEMVLHEGHKIPQSLLHEEMAAVLRTRMERALKDNNMEVAEASMKHLDKLAAGSADDVVQAAFHGASGTMLLVKGKYDDSIAQLEEDDMNPLSMQVLIEAYQKAGQKEKAQKLATKLAAFNLPVIEQALVVPEFRKQHTVASAETAPAPATRNK